VNQKQFVPSHGRFQGIRRLQGVPEQSGKSRLRQAHGAYHELWGNFAARAVLPVAMRMTRLRGVGWGECSGAAAVSPGR